MKRLVIGILAHVDAGKTTLSEGMLYVSGSIRKLGRVDKKDAFLDTYGQERERGITIFSKQALLSLKETKITLLDTPGHVDFSAEMERTLQVLDYGILVISGSDGIQGHTLTLWRLLKHYNIPVFLFINKMDQPDADKGNILSELKALLDENCVDFADQESEEFYESLAVSGEEALNEFLETGKIKQNNIRKLIGERKVFPCFFGSALKLTGVEELLTGVDFYTVQKKYPDDFGARVYKITRDQDGSRLTHLKITGGSLKAREVLCGKEGSWKEKVNQIRIYSGEKFEQASEAEAGEICAVAGLTRTFAGEGLGHEEKTIFPELSPVICYAVLLPEGCDAALIYPKFKLLEEEEPQLHLMWDEQNKEIKIQIMGQVQIEVYRRLIQERFGVDVDFGVGSIVYKETIANTVEGVGHFEPLRHYAEVHLLLEPGETGSGLEISADCSEEVLAKNWQRLVLTHLEEREHPGVLIGAPITDMKITLKSGRAHQKHTEGGDFRQAVYRALRQGLMQAESILLEPYYEFMLEIPESAVGRAMTDIDKMNGSFTLQNTISGQAVLKGMAPMAALLEYQKEVTAYTKGTGHLYCSMKGYYPCHNTQEVLEKNAYNPAEDVEYPADSVFCAHGAGYIVGWDRVAEFMHVESCMKEMCAANDENAVICPKWMDTKKADMEMSQWIGQEEADDIIKRTFYANRKEIKSGINIGWKKSTQKGIVDGHVKAQTRNYHPSVKKDKYLLVDGYNVIFAWEELKELAKRSLDGARGKLMDILCNYQAIKKINLIVVFDAYRLEGHLTEISDYHNIHVVFTKEAEAADQYIEKFAHENSHRYDVTVATSDGLEQVIITGEGCQLISAREFQEEIQRASGQIMETFHSTNLKEKNSFSNSLNAKSLEEMEAFHEAYQRSQNK